MTYKFNNGLSEESIAVVLKQTLMGLSHLHLNAQLHRDINAGHIFFSHYHGIKLAFAATVYEHDYGNHHLRNSTVSVSTVLAAAPEVFYSNDNDDKYTQKADIWLIGITALELAYGGISVSGRKKLPPKKERGLSSFFKPLVKPCCGGGGGAADLSLEFSECFGKVVSKCLDTEPAQRPTTFELLEDEFFKNCSEDCPISVSKVWVPKKIDAPSKAKSSINEWVTVSRRGKEVMVEPYISVDVPAIHTEAEIGEPSKQLPVDALN
ncbi:serine/threonine-protein kinase BLUS1-like [Cornus florida]|uniref:serine/threonine-protein kinase BLUS1-like n=1 Tax=Cornus florida TaxID=4283 RepID=UPI00289F74CB|nr:serine/threonine-protein kinase BLUS1-like [Cornus florida]